MYDDAGRLVSSRPEPEWDDTEREWMHALDEWKRENICSKCGLPKAVCRNAKNERAFDPYFEKCFVTAAIVGRQRDVYRDGQDDQPSHEWGVDINLPTASA